MGDARALFHEGDLAGAIEAARGASDHGARALVAVASGDWATGLAAAEQGLAERTDDGLALWCRGEARVGLGDRPGALADWSRLLEADPSSRTAWKDRAILRALEGDRAGALLDLGAVAALSPDDVVPRLWAAGLGGPEAPLEAFARGDGWSAELARLVLGTRAAADLLSSSLAREQVCQVHGYAGLVAERRREREPALRHYRACRAIPVWHFVVHLWARERLVDHLGLDNDPP